MLQYFQSGWGKGEDPLCSRVSQLSDKHAGEIDPLCGTAESQLFQPGCLHPASDSRSLGLQSKAGGSGRLDLTQASRVAALWWGRQEDSQQPVAADKHCCRQALWKAVVEAHANKWQELAASAAMATVTGCGG